MARTMKEVYLYEYTIGVCRYMVEWMIWYICLMDEHKNNEKMLAKCAESLQVGVIRVQSHAKL